MEAVRPDGSLRVEVDHNGKCGKVIITNPQFKVRLMVTMTGKGLMFEAMDGATIELGPHGVVEDTSGRKSNIGPPVNGFVSKE